ncbi:MAG: signal recognition particle-docking protein FtsY [Roseivirga sp.]
MRRFFSKTPQQALDQGLAKTKQSFWTQLSRAVAGRSRIDETVLDKLEEVLIAADVGLETTVKIIERLEQRAARDKYLNATELGQMLNEEIAALLKPVGAEQPPITTTTPWVILVVGVNGVGKTTTIGKLAARHRQAGKQVILGAADTFRAAAVDQLQQWGQRVGATVLARGMHTDPSAVAHETIQEGLRAQADVILIDTAGRLHTKVHLMNELAKIRRTLQKLIPEAPHEVLLVLDGSTGQNAFVQAEAFTEATAVTSLVITKLDGTAKGGVVIGIADQFQVPVKYIGVGERIEDLQVFDPHAFVETIFSL